MAVSDPEAASYAEQIVQTILASGWNINTYAKSVPGLSKQNLVYAIPNPQQPTPAEQAFIAAIRGARIEVTIEVGNDVLFVGFRAPK
jgi:hypothetical protein